MFALVDVNSFYASCETVFRPDLQGKAVVVVSNNDLSGEKRWLILCCSHHLILDGMGVT